MLGLALLGVTGCIMMLIFMPQKAAAAPQQFTSSSQCQSCHAQVYEEWQSSAHANSWINPDVRSQSKDFSNTDCIDCHAPRPIFETGVGKRVLPRSSRRSEGVDCIACHVLPGGGVAGTMEGPNAVCRPTAKRELTREEFCGVCHDQHKTVQQWKGSRYAEQGIGCIECHMPYRNGDPAQGREHICRGGHDIDMVRSAVEIRGVREEQGWVIEVENVGAGHSFPTDERSRAADLFWRPKADEGQEPVAWTKFYRFRSPYRWETDIFDNLLLVHETRRLPLDDDGSSGHIEVAIYYKRSPYYTDEENPDPDADADLLQLIELKP
jgi:nitrate/TMAO reductase-like tetraheme cytochrome c subunit